MVAALVLAAPAQAHEARTTAGGALLGGSTALTRATTAAAQPTCPTGVPVQAITVVNQANVRPKALALVERAVVDQSMQLRAAWGTPCVQFGSGGWTLTLSPGGIQQNPDGSTSFTTSGEHCGPLGNAHVGTCYAAEPALTVETATLTYAVWARAFSHEIDEALVDPTDDVRWQFGLEEVCDPVENLTYQLDGVPVSDFVFPSYFSDGSGPYDEMGVLTGPQQGTM